MDIASTVVVPDNPKEMKAAIAHMLRQIDEIRELMRADDAAIAQIRVENAALKAETRVLREETESILANLRSIL